MSDHPTYDDDLLQKAQDAAEAHIDALQAELWAWENDDELGEETTVDDQLGPFCGCDTCVVREILYAAAPYLAKFVRDGGEFVNETS